MNTDPSSPKYTVVVPVYNSEHTLAELVERIENTMSRYGNYELLLIDDFSTDNSWKRLIEIKNKREHIRLLRLTRNFGQAAVSICGINEAQADIVISIDDDLQYPPEEISKLIENFNPNEQYLLFGVPRKKKENFFSKFSSLLVESFINHFLIRRKKKMRFSTFRIMVKKRYKAQEYSEKTMRSVQVFFTMVAPELMNYIYVDHSSRKKGKSSYSFLKRVRIALELLLVTTELPLYLFICMFVICLSGALVSLILIFTGLNFYALSPYILPLSLFGFSILLVGFVFLFVYLKKLYLGYLGAEAYAIWEEA